MRFGSVDPDETAPFEFAVNLEPLYPPDWVRQLMVSRKNLE
jgi:hypothetical protein